MLSPIMPVTTYCTRPEGQIVHVGPVGVALWTRPLTSALVQDIRASMEAMYAKFPAGHFGLTIYRFTSLPGGGASLATKTRDEIAALIRDATGKVTANAVVIDCPGVVGTTLWAAFSVVLMLARSPVPTKAFSSVEDAHRWLQTQRAWTPACSQDLLDGLAALQVQMPPRV